MLWSSLGAHHTLKHVWCPFLCSGAGAHHCTRELVGCPSSLSESSWVPILVLWSRLGAHPCTLGQVGCPPLHSGAGWVPSFVTSLQKPWGNAMHCLHHASHMVQAHFFPPSSITDWPHQGDKGAVQSPARIRAELSLGTCGSVKALCMSVHTSGHLSEGGGGQCHSWVQSAHPYPGCLGAPCCAG